MLAFAVEARAQESYDNCNLLGPDGCPLQKLNCPLRQPPMLFPTNGVLDTSLTVAMREVKCVPQVAQSPNPPAASAVTWKTMQLRNYSSPATSGGALQGPTWRLRKAILADPGKPYDPVSNPIASPGTRLRVLLRNSLPNDPAVPIDSCRPLQYTVCTDNPTRTCNCNLPDGSCRADRPEQFQCDPTDPSRTCRMATIEQTAPNCLHGTEVTNLHYHGFHVSPQPHSDFVLLSLYSENQTEPPPPEPGNDPTIAIGTYQTDISPLPWNQAPGTYWYHAHKHGSTAVQTINGMAGAVLIGGELDDFLYATYGVNPNRPQQLARFDKVMVVQQIFPDVAVFQSGKLPPGYPPYPLVNGQLIPTIQMRYGEVQRWRFISATSNAATQQTVQLDVDPATFPGFEVKQIAQDGVQFHPTNYVRQPLGNAVDGYELSPGNRVDLLVRAPDPPAASLAPMVFHVMARVVGGLADDERQVMAEQNRVINEATGVRSASKAAVGSGALVRVYVSGVQSPAMRLPSQWPAMPPYLADQTATGTRYVSFGMTNDSTGSSAHASIAGRFFVDGLQFAHGCAGETLQLGKVEEWRVINNSVPQHPFHIHTNPFQITWRRWTVDANGNPIQPVIQDFEPPYPWMDTIALKPGRLNRQSETRFLYGADDYTGALVLHCHFLGHEDRGMMTNVQVVCPTTGSPATAPISFGTRRSDGKADDCAVPPADAAPLLACPGEEPHEGHSHSH
jgi:FtsP/CotA-like multicopper oxidase with cupredoxin domain